MADLRWYKIEQEIPDGEFVSQISLAGKKLALLRHKGELYLVQNSCPHAGGTLSGGWCEQGKLICPVHRYAYDLETGRGAAGQGDYIDIYPLKQEEGIWYAGFRQSLFQRFFSK